MNTTKEPLYVDHLGNPIEELAAGYAEARAVFEAARAQLEEAVRFAVADGVPKSAIHRATGVSRPTIDAWSTRPGQSA